MTQVLTHKHLRTQEAQDCQKLLDLYEGNQLQYVIKDLEKYRDDWKARKFIPRTRNITKAIIDKSGLLFNQPPALEVVMAPGTAPVVDATFQELMERSDWTEFFQNVDVYARLCKSVIILQQKYVATP